MRSNFYDYVYYNHIMKEVNLGNYSLTFAMREIFKVIREWLHSIHFLPAPPEGHTLSWCCEHDEHGMNELLHSFFWLCKKRGFTVSLEKPRPHVVTHEITLTWAKKSKVVEFVFD